MSQVTIGSEFRQDLQDEQDIYFFNPVNPVDPVSAKISSFYIFWAGESPGRVRISQPLVLSVAPRLVTRR